MSGSLHDVKNEMWMKAVVIGVVLLLAGFVAYGVFTVGVGDAKHHDYEVAKDEYEAAHHAKTIAEEEFYLAQSRWVNDGEPTEGHTWDEYVAAVSALDSAKAVDEEAHHDEIDAHLSYLTWTTLGKTLMVMMIFYSGFYIVAGFFNSIQPEEEHHHDHGDHEEHHGSASPILMAAGILLFMFGFSDFVTTSKAWLGLDYEAQIGGFMLAAVGTIILIIGIGNWWREDMKGSPEQVAVSDPFTGNDIRKAGMWIFLISEMMVFASFFSSYLRMRTEWCTQWALDAGTCTEQEFAEFGVTTASDLLRHDVMTLLPGAINTFALIISSYTIVLALKTAKDTNWKPSDNALMAKLFPTRKKTIRNYLLLTLGLGSLFIVLKLIEWSHLIAEGLTIDTQAGSIFYVATGAHGLHVFIGLLVMLFMIFKADSVGYDEKNGQGIEYFGLYWHFVDLAWVAIFPAFYLY
ncbi:MAG: heme-copper oxidase subunit III [Candidatus Poseidoniaceae archaeon]|jgi:cytochrome c oxidase subunit I+III|nr:heme-copper oxidase subunit III [Candidatus Poseidoniaceae archaeon]